MEVIDEIWKDIPEYDGVYQISNLGRVLSISRFIEYKRSKPLLVNSRILKQTQSKQGYMNVGLRKNGKISTFLVHRLVCNVFVPNPEQKPQVNHINGNKLDNRATNLEWVTAKENTKHANDTKLRNQNGQKNHKSKLSDDQVVEIKNIKGLTQLQIANLYGVSEATINMILNGRTWKHLL